MLSEAQISSLKRFVDQLGVRVCIYPQNPSMDTFCNDKGGL